MTTTEESVAALLDETIAALSALDLERLLMLEEKVLLLARSGVTGGSISTLLERQQILGHVLNTTKNNLANLTRRHRRNGEDVWAR